MIMAVVALLLLLCVPLAGGRLRHLADVHFRAAWLIVIALAMQIVVLSVLTGLPQWLAAGVHIGSYVLAGVFVALNWRIPGLLFIGAGAASNGLTIALNHGSLPASAEAMRRAGITPEVGQFSNSVPLEHPRLSWLGDIFFIPQQLSLPTGHTLGIPFANVFSVGDVLIWVGVAAAVFQICVRPEWRTKRGQAMIDRDEGLTHSKEFTERPPLPEQRETSTDFSSPTPVHGEEKA